MANKTFKPKRFTEAEHMAAAAANHAAITGHLSSDGKNPVDAATIARRTKAAETFEVKLLVSFPLGNLTPGRVAEAIQYLIEIDLGASAVVRSLTCKVAETCDVCGRLQALHTVPCLPGETA
jgi:hypothetical protein